MKIGDLDGVHVAIDGKVQRSSVCAGGAVHVLRAWVDGLSLSAGQATCAAESNESEPSPASWTPCNSRGTTVTIDAAGCQTAIAAQIEEAGAAYILALKANQPQALDAVSAHFGSNPAGLDRHVTGERSRGRYAKPLHPAGDGHRSAARPSIKEDSATQTATGHPRPGFQTQVAGELSCVSPARPPFLGLAPPEPCDKNALMVRLRAASFLGFRRRRPNFSAPSSPALDTPFTTLIP